MIIAVDFDGTLCLDTYPEIGEARVKVVEWVKEQQKLGYKIILWTCREGHLLERAVKWAGERGIVFDAVNENIPELKYMYVGQHKIVADMYLDDKALMCGTVEAGTLPDASNFVKGI